MSQSKIQYVDKVSSNPQPSIPAYNKVTGDDMTEIKKVVNDNADDVSALDGTKIELIDGGGVTIATELGNKVDDSQVLTDVPLGALFTDTVFDPSTIQSDVDTKVQSVTGNKVDNTDPKNPIIKDTIDGNGTTANGDAVDLGGTLNQPTTIFSDNFLNKLLFDFSSGAHIEFNTEQGGQVTFNIDQSGGIVINNSVGDGVRLNSNTYTLTQGASTITNNWDNSTTHTGLDFRSDTAIQNTIVETGVSSTNFLQSDDNFVSEVVDIVGGNTNRVLYDATGFVFTDAINSKGMEYDDDYAANFTDHSLVTKKFVLDNVIEKATVATKTEKGGMYYDYDATTSTLIIGNDPII